MRFCQARKARLVLLSLVIGITYGLSAPTPALAYTTNGCAFSTARVHYSVFLPSSSSYYSVANTAASDWTNTVTPIILVKDADYSGSRILSNDDFGNSNYDGITQHVCSRGHSSSFGSYWNKYYTDGYSSTARRQVMVHELGHALGLGHAGSSNCTGQPIMYTSSDRYFNCGHYKPQPDDINGINFLY